MLFSYPLEVEYAFALVLSFSHDGPAAGASLSGRQLEPRFVACAYRRRDRIAILLLRCTQSPGGPTLPRQKGQSTLPR
jgi:hypothetical protein